MSIKAAIAARLSDHAKVAHRLWSVRATIFWIALNAAIGSLDFFAGTEIVAAHPIAFAIANTVGGVVIGLARILKQPGLA